MFPESQTSEGGPNGPPSTAESCKPPPLKVLTHGELLQLDIAERKSLLGDWLLERHPCMVYAQTGRGKSLFCMSIAMAVAAGGEVFGWKAPEARTVLYIDAEMDLADMKQRGTMLEEAVSRLNKEALRTNLYTLSRHRQSRGAVFPDLVDPEGQKALIALVESVKPSLVVLDNLSTMADIRDENDAAEMKPILDMLWKLRQLDCAVILVHHTGKQEGKFRGSSKLAATFESILQLAPNGDLLGGETGFIVRVDKFRQANKPEPLKVRLAQCEDTGEMRWEWGASRDRQLEEIVRLVRSREFELDREIAEELGLGKVTLSRRKKEAITAGLITKKEWEECMTEARALAREGGVVANDNEEVLEGEC